MSIKNLFTITKPPYIEKPPQAFDKYRVVFSTLYKSTHLVGG